MSNESPQNATDSLSPETTRYVIRMIWFLVFVYLDFQTTLMLMGDVSVGQRQLVVMKSTVLVAGMFLVALYSTRDIDSS